MIVKYDLDGVITNERTWDSWNELSCYAQRTPNKDVIEQMQDLHREGCVIFIETGRRERWRGLTEEWLDCHAVPYHALKMNKMPCDYSVDDRHATVEQIRKIMAERKRVRKGEGGEEA